MYAPLLFVWFLFVCLWRANACSALAVLLHKFTSTYLLVHWKPLVYALRLIFPRSFPWLHVQSTQSEYNCHFGHYDCNYLLNLLTCASFYSQCFSNRPILITTLWAVIQVSPIKVHLKHLSKTFNKLYLSAAVARVQNQRHTVQRARVPSQSCQEWQQLQSWVQWRQHHSRLVPTIWKQSSTAGWQSSAILLWKHYIITGYKIQFVNSNIQLNYCISRYEAFTTLTYFGIIWLWTNFSFWFWFPITAFFMSLQSKNGHR